MQKIRMKEDIEKGQRTKKIIISMILLFILVSSTLGFAFFSNPNSNSQSGVNPNSNIQQNGNYYNLDINGQQFSFLNPPESTQKVPIDMTVTLASYSGKPLFIVSNSDTISAEIASSLGRYASRVQKACYGKCNLDLPEKDCSENLIIWNSSIERSVYQNESCIFILGDALSADAFLYKILGVN